MDVVREGEEAESSDSIVSNKGIRNAKRLDACGSFALALALALFLPLSFLLSLSTIKLHQMPQQDQALAVSSQGRVLESLHIVYLLMQSLPVALECSVLPKVAKAFSP